MNKYFYKITYAIITGTPNCAYDVFSKVKQSLVNV